MNVRSDRAGMLSGAAFALLLFFGMTVMFGGEPDIANNDTAATAAKKWLAAAHSSSHREKVLIGGFMVVLAAVALLWFANTLRNRYAPVGTPLMAFATLASVGVAASMVGPTALIGGYVFGSEPLPADGNVLWALGDTAMPLLLIVYGIAVSAMLATFAVVARAVLPKWLLVVTWVAAIASLGSVVFFPALLVLVYFLVVGIWGGVRAGDARSPVSASAGVAAPA